MRRIVSVALPLLLVLAAQGVSLAAEPIPFDSPALEKRLASYDPAAVAAARHYVESPAVRAASDAMGNTMMKAMSGYVAKQNPTMTPERLAKAQSVASQVMASYSDLMRQMTMVAMLDSLTTEEFVALDKFYSSPAGVSILGKMPQIMAQMPAIVQKLMPSMRNDILVKLKSADPELKL